MLYDEKSEVEQGQVIAQNHTPSKHGTYTIRCAYLPNIHIFLKIPCTPSYVNTGKEIEHLRRSRRNTKVQGWISEYRWLKGLAS